MYCELYMAKTRSLVAGCRPRDTAEILYDIFLVCFLRAEQGLNKRSVNVNVLLHCGPQFEYTVFFYGIKNVGLLSQLIARIREADSYINIFSANVSHAYPLTSCCIGRSDSEDALSKARGSRALPLRLHTLAPTPP